MTTASSSITIPSQLAAPLSRTRIPVSLRPPQRVRQITQPIPQQVIRPEMGAVAPPADQPVADKSWAGLKIMLERGKVKRGFGVRAIEMYRGATSPVSGDLDFMLQQGKITVSEHKTLQQIRHNYRAAVAAGRAIKIKTGTWYDVPSQPTQTYPSDFIGPLPRGAVREQPQTYPSDFIGPLPRGAVREQPQPAPFSIGLPTDESLMTRSLGRGFIETVKRVPTGITMFGEGGFRYVVGGFRGTGKFVSEKEIPWQLAEISERGRGKFPSGTEFELEDYKGLTYGELQERLEISAGLKPGLPEEARFANLTERIENEITLELQEKYKKQISAGKISPEEAQSQFVIEAEKLFQERYSKESKKLSVKLKTVSIAVDKTTGTLVAEKAPQVMGTGLIIGAYALSPVTGGTTGIFASAYLVGTSTKDITTGILGEDLTPKERAGSIFTGGVKAGFGFLGVGSIMGPQPGSLLARQSRKLAQQELEAQRFTISGREITRGEKGGLYRTTYQRATPLAKQEVEVLSPIFGYGEKGARAVGVKAISKTSIADVITLKPSGYVARSTDEFILGAKAGLQPGGKIVYGDYKGLKFGPETPEDIQFFTGTGFIKKRGAETFKEFKLAGAVKEVDEVYKVIAAKPSKVRFGFKNLEFKDVKVKSKITGFGEIKKLKIEDDAVEFISTGAIKKTPFSRTFQAQEVVSKIQTQKVVPIFEQSFVSQVAKQVPKVTVKSIGITPTTAVATKVLPAVKLEQKQQPVLSFGVSEQVRERVLVSGKEKAIQKVKSKEAQKVAAIPSVSLATSNISKTAQIEGVALISGQKLGIKQVQRQAQVQTFFQPTPTIPAITPLFPGEFMVPPPIPIPIKRRLDFRREERTGYQTYVKVGGKFKKISDKPLTRSGAKDIGARYTDNTTSATFKIEPIKQTKVIEGKETTLLKRFKEDELETGTGYFTKTTGKFRQFMIKRGNKLLMQDKWIEKRGRRSDTPGEKQGLTVAQFKARETKRRAGLPVRKSKKKKPSKNVKGFFGIR